MLKRAYLRALFWLAKFITRRVCHKRGPDLVIGPRNTPYLLRWRLLPKNPIFEIFIHQFYNSDDDRALHDHPFFFASWMLIGHYIEHTIKYGGTYHKRRFNAGCFRLCTPWKTHRLEVDPEDPPMTVFFVLGPSIRKWGFHCTNGWIHWKKFVDERDTGQIGPGCN